MPTLPDRAGAPALARTSAGLARVGPRSTSSNFDKQKYIHRNTVERCFDRPKQYRGMATRYDQTRYDQTRESYRAAVTLASTLLSGSAFEEVL